MAKISKTYKPTQKEKFMNAKMKEYFRQKLESCRDDERHHLDDARQRAFGSSGLAVLCWVELVTLGSRFAVAIARIF